MGLVYFLKRFRYYLEGSSFEVLTDNQVLSSFLTKKNLSRRELRWLDLFAEFNLDKLILIRGKIHVLGDALSCIPKESDFVINNFSSSSPHLDNKFRREYLSDQLLGPIYNMLLWNPPIDHVQLKRIEHIKNHFGLTDGLLYYDGKKCISRKLVKHVLHFAHDISTSGHFSFTKTLSRLEKFHWKGKTRDVDDYCKGCQICQKSKNSSVKTYGSLSRNAISCG